MASSSSSSVQQKHEVFLSFRGEDTRNTFISHLHAALKRQKIVTFFDDRIARGEEISRELMTAIEDSKISIIVLSKNYASSSWCLKELCKILECKKRKGQMIVPIFYHVDPSDVRYQRGSFEEAFAKNEGRFKDSRNRGRTDSRIASRSLVRKITKPQDELNIWRAALAEVASLSGYHLQNDKPEAEVIEDIVENIWEKLNCELSSDVEELVGMDSRIEELKELLDHMESDGVRIIGIWGMPGVGKTTTAEVLFKHISSQFDAYYFLANIRGRSMPQALQCARNDLFSKILKKNLELGTPSIKGTFIIDWLRRRKVLIVLDDVNNLQQVEYLIGDQSCFGPGSTIIITSRDEKVLRPIADKIHTVQKLTYEQAHELLIQYAFRGNRSIFMAKYMRLSMRLLSYVDGIPLALKILGSFLNKEEEEKWDSALRRLESAPMKEIHDVLRISYDELEEDIKSIFLDIACFFKGEDKNRVADILDGCGFSVDIGIIVLISKSLISIVNNNLQMHNLIQEMGREIVRQQSKHPGERSRLWIDNDIDNILTTNKGTTKVEGIFLNTSKIEEPMRINREAFLSMCNLRLLKIYNPHSQEDYKVHLPPDILNELPTDLVYLHWQCCPLKSLPLNPKNLVELHMHYSHVNRLWEGTQRLEKLKWIDLSYSQHLKKMPDLSNATNLVRINLVGCTSLLGLALPTRHLHNLKAVYLSGCSNLKNFPLLSSNVEELHLDGTAIEEVPREILYFGRLVKLNLKNCKRLKSLVTTFCKSLEFLDLSGCSSLVDFKITSLNLKELLLNETVIKELPLSFESIRNLVSLKLQNCTSIKYISSKISVLKSLELLDLSGCTRLESVPEFPPNLVRINLVGCTSLLEFPSPSQPLCNLKAVYLSGCSNLKKFSLLSWSVEELHLDGTAIEEVPSEIQNFSRLVKLNMKNCKRLKNLPSIHFELRSLEFLDLSGYSSLMNFLMISSNLKELHLNETVFDEIEELPLSIEFLGNLVSLKLQNCTRIKCISSSIFELKSLELLDLSGCTRLESVPELPPNLQYLDAHNCTSLKADSSSFPIGHGWGQRFIFTNCIELDQNTMWSKTQMSIRQRATADVKLYHKDKEQDLRPRFSSICICFPGSEIPKWFNCQNSESSVSVTTRLFTDMDDHKLMGFTLCAVVAFEDYNKDLGFKIKCRCNIKTNGDDSHDRVSYLSVWDKLDSPRFIGSDHVFFGYDFNLCSDWYSGESKYNLKEAFFEFSACDSDSGNPLDSCRFKKCGVCLLYAQDNLSEIEIVGESEIKCYGESESDAKECNPRMIKPSSPFNPHFVSDGITAKRPCDNYCHDEAGSSGNFSYDEDEELCTKRLK